MVSPLRSVTRSYFRNSAGGLLIFDMTNRASFEHIKEWHREVCDHVHPHRVLFILVGNKSDKDKGRVVSREEAEVLARQLGLPYVEVSAKTGQNVSSAFELLAGCIYKGLLSGEVKLQEGWDGVKCLAPQGPRADRAIAGRSTSAPKSKCCS